MLAKHICANEVWDAWGEQGWRVPSYGAGGTEHDRETEGVGVGAVGQRRGMRKQGRGNGHQMKWRYRETQLHGGCISFDEQAWSELRL